MMTIKQIEVTVGEIVQGYINNDELGVRGYNGRISVLPISASLSTTIESSWP